jgi:hypothetical protein
MTRLKLGNEVLAVGQDKTGAPYAHLYVGGGHKLNRQQVFARVIFYERPPGTIASILFVVLLTLGTLGLYLPYLALLVQADNAASSAFLLALPGTAAIWIGKTIASDERLLVAPISARAGVFLAGVSSLLATVLSAVARLGDNASTKHVPVWLLVFWWVSIVILLGVALQLSRLLRRNSADLRQGQHRA